MNFVDRLYLPTTGLAQELLVRLANGVEVCCGETLTDFEVGLVGLENSPTFKLDLKVLPDLKFDCVLGLPWLEKANPDINWANRTVTLKSLRVNESEFTPGDSLIKERSSSFKLQNLTISESQDMLKFAPFDKPRTGNKHKSNYQNKREIKTRPQNQLKVDKFYSSR
jgi:hypothetical protein